MTSPHADVSTHAAGFAMPPLTRALEPLAYAADPAGPLTADLLHERYVRRAASAESLAAYYRLKPAIPRPIQLAARRTYARRLRRRHEAGDGFPRWPIEPVLVERLERHFRARLRQTGAERLPLIGLWPDRHRFAFILTHDVEGPRGLANVPRMLDVERRHGMVSSWNLVGDDYAIEPAVVDAIHAAGGEIGLHGLTHDGRLFESRRAFERQLPGIRERVTEWGAEGFRSPSTLRNAAWMPELPVSYDSSFPDTDPFEPHQGGCCSVLPFFLGPVVELPMTLTQDHTLFEILRERDIALWRRKASWIARHGGLVTVLVHPDYMLSEDRLRRYEELLEFLSALEGGWHALPRDVAGWWRRRAALDSDLRDGQTIDESTLQAADACVAWAHEERGQMMFDTAAPADREQPSSATHGAEGAHADGPGGRATTATQTLAAAGRSARRNGFRAHAGAIVVGGDYQGVGIVRSLGRRGVQTCVIDDEQSIARFSRYATRAVRVDSLRDERRTVDHVLDIGDRFGLGGWVLYPTREQTVAAFSHHRSELTAHFRVPTPPFDVVRWAWDKRNTYARANALGIPTPRTWQPAGLAQLEAIDCTPPFAVKPAIKEHFLYATKAKAWRADSCDELRDRFRAASALVGSGEVLIQELIPGGGSQQYAYCALFKDGRAMATMVVRRARQHPPEFGRASTFVETVDVPELEELSERFLRSIGYYGLVELEYKLDPRDGQYKLLDVNARTWGYHSLGPRAGVDFPALLHADQIGEPVETVRARPGVAWIRLATDVPTAVAELLAGRLDWRAYLRSVRTADTEAVFSRKDPLPGLAEIALLPYLAVVRGF